MTFAALTQCHICARLTLRSIQERRLTQHFRIVVIGGGVTADTRDTRTHGVRPYISHLTGFEVRG